MASDYTPVVWYRFQTRNIPPILTQQKTRADTTGRDEQRYPHYRTTNCQGVDRTVACLDDERRRMWCGTRSLQHSQAPQWTLIRARTQLVSNLRILTGEHAGFLSPSGVVLLGRSDQPDQRLREAHDDVCGVRVRPPAHCDTPGRDEHGRDIPRVRRWCPPRVDSPRAGRRAGVLPRSRYHLTAHAGSETVEGKSRETTTLYHADPVSSEAVVG